MPVARRVFIISDWHLGGTSDSPANSIEPNRLGSQICRSVMQLAEFIDWVRAQTEISSAPPTELIVNGDMVDFLAPDEGKQPQAWTADEAAAIAKLDRIVKKSPAPFEALKRLLCSPKCSLTLLLGNHDVELSLPLVRRHLQERILCSDGRGLEFIFGGEACVRGQLLVEHGNRYDPWNQLNYSGLRQECSLLSRGLTVAEVDREEHGFRPPAGTLLVVHAINHLLPRYPFINLLKPETGAMLPLLLSLQPDLWPVLKEIVALRRIPALRSGARLTRPALPADPGALGGASEDEYDVGSLSAVLSAELGATDVRAFDAPVSGRTGGELGGEETQSMFEELRRFTAALAAKAQFLSTLSRAWLGTTEAKRRAQARIALGRLAGDDYTWDLAREGAPAYEDAARELLRSGRFSHVVFGHTHLPKKILIERPGQLPGYYLNAGAWADVIRLPAALATSGPAAEEALAEFIDRVEQRNLEALLARFNGFAEIEFNPEGEVCRAEIYSYGGPGHERLPALTSFCAA